MNKQPRIRRHSQMKVHSIPEHSLTVRMYDVGFGDCFLLRLPGPDGKVARVMFDCGSIKLGANPMKNVVQQVISDARPSPGEPARIDVVIATHRHRDHISGFADPAWAEVEVGEVWMPWIEKPDQSEARRIREMQSRLAEQLVSRLQLRLAATSDPAAQGVLTSGLDLAMNALSE